MALRKATRQKTKLRMGMAGPSGSGKTYSALLLASGMTSWDKIALIDTENGSGDLYSDLGEYSVCPLSAPFTPEKYISAIKECEDAGMEVIIIDSITHEWDGKGGLLEVHSKMPGNSFTNWRKITPRHNSFIEAILQSKCHMITTVRKKQDYDMVKDGNGKLKPVKVGLKEITREGFEYELTLNFEVDMSHNVTTGKDRTGLFVDKPDFIITSETGETLKNWCESGADVIKELAKKTHEDHPENPANKPDEFGDKEKRKALYKHLKSQCAKLGKSEEETMKQVLERLGVEDMKGVMGVSVPKFTKAINGINQELVLLDESPAKPEEAVVVDPAEKKVIEEAVVVDDAAEKKKKASTLTRNYKALAKLYKWDVDKMKEEFKKFIGVESTQLLSVVMLDKYIEAVKKQIKAEKDAAKEVRVAEAKEAKKDDAADNFEKDVINKGV